VRIAPLAAVLALVAGTATSAQDSEPYFVREGMVHAINPPITAIWDLQVEAMDDEGNFSPALMDEAKWAALTRHARALEAATRAMSAAPAYAASDPAGALGAPPEGTDLAAINARLTASPATFRALSDVLANHSAALAAAADARDPALLTRLVNDTQPVCKACHYVFWYPEAE